MRPAEDAVILNSDGLDADQVFEVVLQMVREAGEGSPPPAGERGRWITAFPRRCAWDAL